MYPHASKGHLPLATVAAMPERRSDEATRQMGVGIKRRGILAVAGAVVAGIVAE